MKIGCNSPNVIDFTAKLGQPIEVCRCFAEQHTWTESRFDAARAAVLRGEDVLVSIKPVGSWASVAGGSNDSRIAAVAQGLVATGGKGGFGINHEPENDGGIAADFVAMQRRFLSIVEPIFSETGFNSAIILMGDAFRKGTQDTWIGDAKPKILAADTYLWRGANQGSAPWASSSEPTVSASTMVPYLKHLDYCKAHGFIPELWEFGCARSSADTAGAKRTACIQTWASEPRLEEYRRIAYFEMNQGEAGVAVNWSIRNEPASMAAFRKLSTVTPPPPPPSTCEEDLAATLVLLAEAESDIAGLSAANVALVTERDALKARIAAHEATPI